MRPRRWYKHPRGSTLIGLLVVQMVWCLLAAGKACAKDAAYVRGDASFFYAGNERTELVFRKSDGELYSLIDRRYNRDYIVVKDAWYRPYHFWAVVDGSLQNLGGFCAHHFKWRWTSTSQGVALMLTWSRFQSTRPAPLDIQVTITVEIQSGDPLTAWRIAIQNRAGVVIQRVDFPEIHGLGRIGTSGSTDFVVHPAFGGLLWEDAFENLKESCGWGQNYPSSGCPMQFVAYYSSDPPTGLYLATCDTQAYSKSFWFTKPASDRMSLYVTHTTPYAVDVNAAVKAPAVVGVFDGDWYDAAQIYRQWAVQQPFTSAGKLVNRRDVPEWLKNLGLHAWFYTHPSGGDTDPFSTLPDVIEDASQFTARSVAVDWIGWEKNWWYVYYPDVFPPSEGWQAFNDTIAKVHRSGNHLLFLPCVANYSSLASDWQTAKSSAATDAFGKYLAAAPCTIDSVSSTMTGMCPGTDFWQSKLRDLLLTLASEGADVIQLDGFPCHGWLPCSNPSHGHPLGGGNWWSVDYARLFADVKQQARLSNPDFAYTAEGTSETCLSLLDSMQDPYTAGWSPTWHTDVYADVSKVHLIPLWHTVYHDYGLIHSTCEFVGGNDPDWYRQCYGLEFVWGELPTTWLAGNCRLSHLAGDAANTAAYLRRIVQMRAGDARPFVV